MASRPRRRIPSDDRRGRAAASRRAKKRYAILMVVVSIAPVAFLVRGAYRVFVTHERVKVSVVLLFLGLLIVMETIRAVFVLRS